MIEVVCGIIIENGTVFVAQRNPFQSYPGLWEFPGGKINDGETHREALKRELLEELSIDCEVGDYIITIGASDPYDSWNLHTYHVETDMINLHLNVHSAAMWVPILNLHKVNLISFDHTIAQQLVWMYQNGKL